MMSGRSCSSSRYPFTASQWQELEQQALIYKYMASGLPIPFDLIHPIRRSFLLQDSSPSSFPPQTQLGWSCFHMGFGRKAEIDPEPGRCRRTDGKKWRCSKEAYPDSKYCERHMHRGKNRSRKPVEISLAPNKATNHSSSSSASVQPSSPYPNPQYGGMRDLEGCGFVYGMPGAERERASSDQFMGKQSSYSLSKEEEEERQKTLLHFFDEGPQRNKDSWMDLEEENCNSFNKTQLSISFPKWSYLK